MQYTRNLHAHKTQYNRYTTGDLRLVFSHRLHKVKGKVFPYSLPSVGPGADPGVQAVSPQVT